MKSIVSTLMFALLLTLTISGATSAQDAPIALGGSRGYLTTPQELRVIAQKASQGIEPYASAVAATINRAKENWNFDIGARATCSDADDPRWIDEDQTRIVYAKALAYHLTGKRKYARQVKNILEHVMSRVKKISKGESQCRLNFSWGIPEYVAAADLIEDFWKNKTCYGPVSTEYRNRTRAEGNCKQLFQNWLVKNPYFVISPSIDAHTNWGAAATNAAAYIADYLWDRPEVGLVHRLPSQIGGTLRLSPSNAYSYANARLFERLNGYGVDYHGSSSCDYLKGEQQNSAFTPVKSQITEAGIIPEEARREEFCNVPKYNGEYQNYPQVYLNNTIQQCELMLRRGNAACYNNIDNTDIPQYRYSTPDGTQHVTHLYAGRGSVERAINAIIVDSDTEWKHNNALYVAYRYYMSNSRFGKVGRWAKYLERNTDCTQGICFGKLTHGIAPGENPTLPPTVSPP